MNRVEICGNIASGKTTLCKSLSLKGFTPVFENFQKNPFLEKFYEDPQKYSFETEITFLLLHYHSIKIQDITSRIVCDYSLLQDLAYADINLIGDRYKIFCEIVEELQNEIALPSLIINLTCPEEILLKRITERRRNVETSIIINYLRALNKAISIRIKKISGQIKIISVDSNVINFTSSIENIHEFE